MNLSLPGIRTHLTAARAFLPVFSFDDAPATLFASQSSPLSESQAPNSCLVSPGVVSLLLRRTFPWTRKRASDFPQELLDLLDRYVHGHIDRRDSSTALRNSPSADSPRWRSGRASAPITPGRNKFPKTTNESRPNRPPYLATRQRHHTRIPGAPGQRQRKAAGGAGGAREPRPESLHRGCGAALGNREASWHLAPDGLTSVGGYPGDDEKGPSCFSRWTSRR